MKYVPQVIILIAAALCAYKASKLKGDKRMMWGIAAGLLAVGGGGWAYAAANAEPAVSVDTLVASDDYVAPPQVQQKQADAMVNQVQNLPLPPAEKQSLQDQLVDIATTAATDYAKEQMIRALPGMTEDVANGLISSFKSESGGGGAPQPYVPPKVTTGVGKNQAQELATYMRQSDPGTYEIVVLDGARKGEVVAVVHANGQAGNVADIKAANLPPGISLWAEPNKTASQRVPEDVRWPVWEFLMQQLKSRGIKDKTPA